MYERVDLSAVDERIETLRRKVYELSEFGADFDESKRLERVMNLRAYRDELEQLLFLRNLAGQIESTKELKRWQVAIILFFFGVSFAGTTISLFMWLATR